MYWKIVLGWSLLIHDCILMKNLVFIFLQPIPRWCVDYELYSLCKKKPGFEIPVAFGDSVVDFPGTIHRMQIIMAIKQFFVWTGSRQKKSN